MSNPVFFIGGLPKSGTSLLMTLLDGHPEVTVMPVETRFLQQSRRLTNLNDSTAFVTFIENNTGFATFNKKSNRFKTESNQQPKEYLDAFDFNSFKNTLEKFLHEKIMPLTLQETFAVIAEAYAHTRFEKPAKKIVEKTPSNEFHLDQIRQEFSDHKMIYVLRNPIANFVSYNNYQKERGKDVSPGFFLRSLRSHRVLRENTNDPRFAVVKYEDLVNNPESTMRHVSDFLGISYYPSMLVPTIAGGVPWGGNSTKKKKFSSISQSRVEGFKNDSSGSELEFYSFLYNHKPLKSFNQLADFFMLDYSLVKKIKFVLAYLYSRVFFRQELVYIKDMYSKI